MADIFLSYASEDRERVRPIVEALQANGWNVWWDRELKPGPSFDREIEKAMDDCHCVVVVWSSRSVESEWVRVEAGEGAERGILVPLSIDGSRPPLAFRNRQTADLSEADSTDAAHEYRQFMRAVADTLSTADPGTSPQPATQLPPPVRSSPLSRQWLIASTVAVPLVLAILVIGFLDYNDRALAPSLQPTSEDIHIESADPTESTVLTLPTESRAAFDHYLRGRALIKGRTDAGQFDIALQEFDAALALDPGFAEAQAGICSTHLLRYRRDRRPEDFSKAEQACFRALTLQKADQSDWELRLALGNLYREAGQYEKSLAELTAANRSHPNSPEVMLQMGLAYAHQGDTERADSHLMRAVALEPNNWHTRVALGNFRYEQADYEGSLSVFEEILSVEPDHPGALIGVGSVFYMLQRYGEATQAWDRAAELVGDDERGSLAILQSNLGLYYYYEGEFEQAAAKQAEATLLAPDNHRIQGRLAESHRHAGNEDDARRAYLAAIKLAEAELRLNPHDWETLGLLGLYHGFSGNSEQARRYAGKMLLVVSVEPTAYYFDALVYWSLGDVDQTFAALEVATSNGFSPELIRNDPDLAKLQAINPERFEALLASAGNRN